MRVTSSSVKGKMGPSFTVLERAKRHNSSVIYRDTVDDKSFSYREMMKLQVIWGENIVTTLAFFCVFVRTQLSA